MALVGEASLAGGLGGSDPALIGHAYQDADGTRYGELVWHAHADEDELFMVHRGTFGLKFRDGRDIRLRPGDVYVVPCGVEHFPYAEEETEVIFFEPAATKHTGHSISEKTRSIEEQLRHLSRPI